MRLSTSFSGHVLEPRGSGRPHQGSFASFASFAVIAPVITRRYVARRWPVSQRRASHAMRSTNGSAGTLDKSGLIDGLTSGRFIRETSRKRPSAQRPDIGGDQGRRSIRGSLGAIVRHGTRFTARCRFTHRAPFVHCNSKRKSQINRCAKRRITICARRRFQTSKTAGAAGLSDPSSTCSLRTESPFSWG